MYINPYESTENAKWRKANLHLHSGVGDMHPADMMTYMYYENGYDFLCLSNHNVYKDFSEYSDDESMKILDGVEYSGTKEDPRDMLTIGVRESLFPIGYQEAIDKTNAVGGFVILCHPNCPVKNTFSPRQMLDLHGYLGLEVLNWKAFTLGGNGDATENWDELLTAGVMATGFGNDDCHMVVESNHFYNLIACEEKSLSSVRQAIVENKVCVSSGLYPVYLRIENGQIRVKVKLNTVLDTHVKEFYYTFVGPNGKILAEQYAEEGVYTLKDEAYVRVEARIKAGPLILFQPVYQEGALVRP